MCGGGNIGASAGAGPGGQPERHPILGEKQERGHSAKGMEGRT